MAVVTLKSPMITSLSASPPVRTTAGQGASGLLVQADGYITVGAADSSASIYKLVRVPSNAIVKRLELENHGTITTLTGDVGAYYSDEAYDQTGSSIANSGAVIDVDFFGSAVAKGTVDVPQNVTNESGTYDVSKRGQPLWQAIGLTTDPGGNFDLALTLTAGASITGTVTVALAAEWTQPYL